MATRGVTAASWPGSASCCGPAWADLSVEFGNSDAVRKRFRRWCQAGIWQRLFEGTVTAEQVDKRLLDGTICKAHRSATGARAARPKTSAAPAAG